MPYISMKMMELMANQSSSTPNMIGSRKPPSPPARPTMPETAPMLSGNSSPMYLKVEAMPKAKTIPSTKSSTVKSQIGSAMRKLTTPSRVRIASSVRSEEHTSELQSRGHLVCRLLLEKKNDTLDRDGTRTRRITPTAEIGS